MKKTIVTIAILLTFNNLFSQINVEIRNSVSIFGFKTEYLLGYKFSKVNSCALFTFNGDKGINNEFYLLENDYNGVFVNHRIYFDKYDAFIFDLPQLGYLIHPDENTSIKFILGPDIINVASVGIGVNYIFK